MGGSDLLGPLFFGLIFLFLYFLASRKPKKKEGYFAERTVYENPLPPQKRARPKKVEVRKMETSKAWSFNKKRTPILQKGWSKRSSLKQAFILSEVFKRHDEL